MTPKIHGVVAPEVTSHPRPTKYKPNIGASIITKVMAPYSLYDYGLWYLKGTSKYLGPCSRKSQPKLSDFDPEPPSL